MWWAERIQEGRERRVATMLEIARVLVLSHPRTPDGVFAPLADGASWPSLVAAGTVARADGGSAARIFAHVSGTVSPRPPTWVRAALAWNGRWPVAILRHASRDRSRQVRAGLATRPGLPDDLVARFLYDRRPSVRAALASRGDLQPLVGACLAVDPDLGVRSASRSGTDGVQPGPLWGAREGARALPRRLAARRARDPDPSVRRDVLTDRRVTLTTLARWTWDLHEWRGGTGGRSLGRHPTTPGENLIAIELHERLLAQAWGITRVVGRRDEDESHFVRPFDPPRVVGGWERYVWVALAEDGEVDGPQA